MANVLTALKKGGTTGTTSGNCYPHPFKLELDIAAFVAAGGLTTEYAILMTIPARTCVEILSVNNATALSMGSGPAVSVGDSSSATLYVNAASTLTADTMHTVATRLKNYSAASDIRVTLTGGTLASGVIQIYGMLHDLGRVAPATFVA